MIPTGREPSLPEDKDITGREPELQGAQGFCRHCHARLNIKNLLPIAIGKMITGYLYCQECKELAEALGAAYFNMRFTMSSERTENAINITLTGIPSLEYLALLEKWNNRAESETGQ